MRKINRIVTVGIGLLVSLMIGMESRAAEQRYALSPQWKAGQRYAVTWQMKMDVNTVETWAGQVAYPEAYLYDNGQARVIVSEVRDGKVVKLEINLGRCTEVSKDGPLDPKPHTKQIPYSNKAVVLSRQTDPQTKQEQLSVTIGGKGGEDEEADIFDSAFVQTLLPGASVAVGERWRTEHLETIFGPRAKGVAELKLARVGRQKDKDVAIVEISGNAFTPRDAATYIANFTGTLTVDLAQRVVESIDLRGTGSVDIDLPNGKVSKRGVWAFQRTTVMETPLDIVVDVEKPEEPPKDPKDPNVAIPKTPGEGPEADNPLSPNDKPAVKTDRFAGYWEDKQAGMIIEFTRQGNDTNGAILFNKKMYLLVSKEAEGRLEGSFWAALEAKSPKFVFTATREGQTVKFTTGKTTYTLAWSPHLAEKFAPSKPDEAEKPMTEEQLLAEEDGLADFRYNEKTGEGVEAMFKAIIQTHKSGTPQRAARLVQRLIVREPEGWFGKVFGEQQGNLLAAEYRETVRRMGPELPKSFAELIAKGRTEVSVEEIKADAADLTDAQKAVFDSMTIQKKPRLYRVRLTEPGQKLGTTFWYVTYLSGSSFKLVGQLRLMGSASATQPATEPTTPPAAAGEGRPGEAAYLRALAALKQRDFPSAVRELQEAAAQGHAEGMAELGQAYQLGVGVTVDPKAAVEWYRKSIDAGSFAGMIHLAVCLDLGKGVEADPVEAFRWYRKAADGGFALGMRSVAWGYLNGRGVAKDELLGVQWMKKAVEKGDAGAMNDMGYLLENGRGIAADLAEAANWYRKAAENGVVIGMVNYALKCQYGRGVGQSYPEAMRWYRAAAEKRNAQALTNLAWMLVNGQGVEKSKAHDAEALKLVQQAADLGYPEAITGLGWLSQFGRGVAADDADAVKWYRKGAERGDAWGMFLLGQMYEAGRGVVKDADGAVEWYRKAAAAGRPDAKKRLEELGK